MSSEQAMDQAVAEGGAYEVIRRRLEEQARALQAATGKLNDERISEFGKTTLDVIGRARVRTENSCVARDIVRVGPYLLFGYNVFIGLKKETRVEDVFGLYALDESGSQFEIAPVPAADSFLADPRFRKDFEELYAYYKESHLVELTRHNQRVFAVFKIGASIDDIRVFQWQVNESGQAKYIDNRGERDIPRVASHDFEWTTATRDMHVSGKHAHISILDKVFVETLGGDLTVKVENNTEDGLGIYQEPVEDTNQSLADAYVGYAEVGQLVLLKVLPYRETDYRYLVVNPDIRQVDRLDAIGNACVRLPEDHGIIFPGGYYLQNGETKVFPDRNEGLAFKRTFRSPNGEDVLYMFYELAAGVCELYSYNLIRKELHNPIYGHGSCWFDDGKAIVFSAEPEPTRIHPMQVWQTPYFSDEFAAKEPPSDSFIGKIGNKELVRGISDFTAIYRMIEDPNPTRQLYESLIRASNSLFDSYFWVEDEHAHGIGGVVKDVTRTAELVIDEFEKVQAIRAQAVKSLQATEQEQAEILAQITPDEWNTPEQYVSALDQLRKQRGHLITLRDQRYIDLDRLTELDDEVTAEYEDLSQKTAGFLSSDSAMDPYFTQIEELHSFIETTDVVIELRPQLEELEKISDGFDLIMEIINTLKIDDATQRTRILEDVSEVYGKLNQSKATCRNRIKELGSGEASAEFAAQFRLFSQSVNSAIALVDTPEKADDQLSRLLVQLEELESKFSEYDEFLADILAKREELYEAFEERKQSLIEQRQRRAHTITQAAERIVSNVQRRAAGFKDVDELNTFYASDPMVLKVGELAGQLRELDDQVHADDMEARLKSAKEQAIRALRDKLDIYEGGGDVIRLGQHRFSVNTQEFDLTLLNRGDEQVIHLIGTDYFEPVNDQVLNQAQQFWDQLLVSETADVYRSEYLASEILNDADRENTIGDLERARQDGALLDLVQSYTSSRYQEGYEKGVHDADCVKILEALLQLRAKAGLLRFSPDCRALALLFWTQNLYNDVRKGLWRSHGRSAALLEASLDSVRGFENLSLELAGEITEFVDVNGLHFDSSTQGQAADYLARELSRDHLTFTVSKAAQVLTDSIEHHLEELGHRRDYLRAIEEYGSLNTSARRSVAENTPRPPAGVADQWRLTEAWISAFIDAGEDEGRKHYVPEAVALMIADKQVERAMSSATLSTTVGGLLGEHSRIQGGELTIYIDEFESRLKQYREETVPGFRAYQAVRQRVVDDARTELHVDDYRAKPLSSFVRNQLIDQVYLPIVGDNLAKQMGTVGDDKRTDLMGLLLLISPPGYGKTTLMEYVADRFGLVFMKINCPSLGHEVTSLDPAAAPNSTAAQEIQKINLAFEMGNNVMLYLDDIQHTHPEFLQKFISLCDGTRRIEGVWQDQSKTYDLRGKRFCVIMAGNPYTESGDTFKVPDMLTNRADTYNLGDERAGRERQFAMSFIENALTSNPVLAPLALRDMKDVYLLLEMANGQDVATTDLTHPYSSAEINEIVEVLKRLTEIQSVVLKVNEEYIASAAQENDYRTEPAFKLQGSYRNMNKMAEKVSAIMDHDELMDLVSDHYQGEAQTLTTGAEQNLLKLGELRGSHTEDERARWEDILSSFQRMQSLGGDDLDAAAKVANQMSHVAQSLVGINSQMKSIGQGNLASPINQISSALDALGQLVKQIPTTGSESQENAADETAEEIRRLADALSSNGIAITHQTDPGLVQLVKVLTSAFEEQLDPVIKSIENKNLIDLDIWERVKGLAENIEEAKEQAAQYGEALSAIVDEKMDKK